MKKVSKIITIIIIEDLLRLYTRTRPEIKLNTANQIIPSFIYGTAWKKEATAHLVLQAISAGFVAIDTANQIKHYDESLVGEALLSLFNQGIKRETLFLQTKFTPVNGQDHRTPYNASDNITTQVEQSFNSSLKHLHTNYIDSYLLHGPYSGNGLIEEDWEAWKAIEGIYKSGKTKMIGVSNVNAEQLSLLCDRATIKPMTVQNRCYSSMGWDKEVRKICRDHNIVYQGFSLLTANQHTLMHPKIRAIANRLNTGPEQVIFRFAKQIGILPLTGTTNRQHMEEDLKSENLEISMDETELIGTL